MTAALDEELNLFGSAHDEGLPRGRAFTAQWTMLKGPGKATFAPPASARTKATFSAPGLYELELSASDGEFTERVRLNVRVGSPRDHAFVLRRQRPPLHPTGGS